MTVSRRDTRTCTLCDRPATDPHHVLHRGRGGEDVAHNIMDICRGCHDAHHQGVITIDAPSFARGWLCVYSGTKPLLRRPLPQPRAPCDDTAVDAVSSAIQRVEDAAEFGLERASLEELTHVAEAVLTLTHAWPLRAEAIQRAYDGWLLWEERGIEQRKTYKLQAIAKRFGVHPGTARQEYDIACTFTPEGGSFAAYAAQSPVKDFSVWRAAQSQDNPWRALEAMEELTGMSANVSVEQQLAVMEGRLTKEWYVKFPKDSMPGQWVRYKELERERR